MTRLSVNINKIATIRNARGSTEPSVTEAAVKCQAFGAQGITVHPRPDQRHITRQDVYDLKPLVYTEFNIEGNPQKEFLDLVIEMKPDQVTLVPDAENVLTSNAGWNTQKHQSYLTEIITELKKHNIRTSLFLDPDPQMVEYAFRTGTDRIELYTEAFAQEFSQGNLSGITPYVETAQRAEELGMSVNAGHDLNLQNIAYLKKHIPNLAEVSIGHALISEALYLGLENTIQLYLSRLN